MASTHINPKMIRNGLLVLTLAMTTHAKSISLRAPSISTPSRLGVISKRNNEGRLQPIPSSVYPIKGRIAGISIIDTDTNGCSSSNRQTVLRGGGSSSIPFGAAPVPSIKWPIFINFMYFLSIALTAPALPAFCNSLYATGGADKVNPSGVRLHGLFSFVDQLFTFLFVSFWGSLSDRIGRKPLIILSSIGISSGWLTVALTSSLPLLLSGRAIDGITSCMLPISQSMVRDLSHPDKLTRNLGLLQGLSVGFAFIVGGISGGILTQNKGPRFVFKLASACGAVAALCAITLLPETLHSNQIPDTFLIGSMHQSSFSDQDKLIQENESENAERYNAFIVNFCNKMTIFLQGKKMDPKLVEKFNVFFISIFKTTFLVIDQWKWKSNQKETLDINKIDRKRTNIAYSNQAQPFIEEEAKYVKEVKRGTSGLFSTILKESNPLSALVLLFKSRTSTGATLAFLCFWFGLNGVQINLFNFVQYKFGWSKLQSVKLQALSGVILALSNTILPSNLSQLLGKNNTVRVGMLGLITSLLAMCFTDSQDVFKLAVCGASVSTLCLPLLMSKLACCYDQKQAGSCLSALETANTLNRGMAYFFLSRVFGWSLSSQYDGWLKENVGTGLFFALGAAVVGFGMIVFEATQ